MVWGKGTQEFMLHSYAARREADQFLARAAAKRIECAQDLSVVAQGDKGRRRAMMAGQGVFKARNDGFEGGYPGRPAPTNRVEEMQQVDAVEIEIVKDRRPVPYIK